MSDIPELPDGYKERLNDSLQGVVHYANKAFEVAGEFLADEIECGDDTIKIVITRQGVTEIIEESS